MKRCGLIHFPRVLSAIGTQEQWSGIETVLFQ